MLLTISLDGPVDVGGERFPASDLAWLLAKNPGRTHAFDLNFGTAYVTYSEVSEAHCTAVLYVELDTIALVRGRPHGEESPLAQYVNDRPYVGSSFLAVTLNQTLRSALKGRCAERPTLVGAALPYELHLPAVPIRGGASVLARLAEPLGWSVQATRLPLDPQFPEWGEGRLFDVKIRATSTLSALLSQLYVLLPVLDDQQHYWVGEPEVDKLLAAGEGWLADHPEQRLVAERWLKHRRSLVDRALSELDADEDDAEPAQEAGEQAIEKRISLNEARIVALVAALRELQADSVLDLGCGEGRLVHRLAEEPFARVCGADVSLRALEIATRRLERLPRPPELFQASLVYRDARFEGFDAITLVEVIEHVDATRLGAVERVVFGAARAGAVLVTTPNREYNAKFEMRPDQMRHKDHRFEWTRAEFAAWADRVARDFGYRVEIRPIGEVDPDLGAPTQLALFRRAAEAA